MIRRLIDMQAASEIGGPSMQAYGTPEGVEKAWDTRGRSGKHPEHGTFERTGSSKGHDYYKGKGGSIVHIQHPQRANGMTKVFEQNQGKGNEQQVFRTYRDANASQNNDYHQFLSDRYGIK